MGVATAVAIGGLALSAGTTAMSFVQAGEQNNKQRQAEASAASAMAEARKKLEVNFYNKQAIKKEPYELKREALLSQGALAIQAGQESERGAVVTAGKTQMAMNEGQSGITTEMIDKMDTIENRQLAEDSRLRDLGAQLDLGVAEGAQMAAANAEEASNAATAQGIQGVMSMGQQGLNMLPLYFKDSSTQAVTQGDNLKAAGLSPSASITAPMASLPTAAQLQGPKPATGLPSGFFPQGQNFYGNTGFNFSGVGGR
jgi:type II secretory pathway pseudopilin PulG